MVSQAQSTMCGKPANGQPGLPGCPPTDNELIHLSLVWLAAMDKSGWPADMRWRRDGPWPESVERGQRLARERAAAQRARLEKAKAEGRYREWTVADCDFARQVCRAVRAELEEEWMWAWNERQRLRCGARLAGD